jgi:hypothetical protein
MKSSYLNPRFMRYVFPLWRSSVELSILCAKGFDFRARKI